MVGAGAQWARPAWDPRSALPHPATARARPGTEALTLSHPGSRGHAGVALSWLPPRPPAAPHLRQGRVGAAEPLIEAVSLTPDLSRGVYWPSHGLRVAMVFCRAARSAWQRSCDAHWAASLHVPRDVTAHRREAASLPALHGQHRVVLGAVCRGRLARAGEPWGPGQCGQGCRCLEASGSRNRGRKEASSGRLTGSARNPEGSLRGRRLAIVCWAPEQTCRQVGHGGWLLPVPLPRRPGQHTPRQTRGGKAQEVSVHPPAPQPATALCQAPSRPGVKYSPTQVPGAVTGWQLWPLEE